MPSPYLSRLKLEKELERKAKMLKEKKQKCENFISSLGDILNILKNRIDIGPFKSEFDKAKNYYETKDFDRALEIFESLSNKVNEKLKDVFNKEKQKIEEILKLIDGEDVAQIRADIQDAEEKLATSPEEAFEILSRVQKRLEGLVDEKVATKRTELKERIAKIKGFEWVASKVDSVSGSSIDAFLELKKIEDEAVSKLNSIIEGIMKKTGAIVELASSAHFNLPVDSSINAKISEMLNSGNYEGALRTAAEYYDKIKKFFTFFFKKLLEISKTIVEEGKGMNIDVSAPLKKLEEAEKLFKEEKFKEAIATIRQATEEAEKLKFQRVLDVIKIAREKLLEARGRGIDIEPYMQKLDGARNFLKVGRHKRAYDIVVETLNLIERKLNLYNQLKDEISTIKRAIEELKEENIILEGIDEKIAEIEEVVEKDAERAEKMIDELKSVIKISLRDIAQSLYDYMKEVLSKSENEGIEVEDMKMELDNIANLIHNESYKDAIVTLRRMEESVYERISNYITSQMERFKSYGDSRIEEEISKINAAMEEWELTQALDHLAKIKDLAFEIEGRKYREEIKDLKERITFLQDAGANVTEAIGYIERAENALRKKDVVMTEEYLSKAREIVTEMESTIAKEIFDSAKSVAATAKKSGVNIQRHGIMGLLKKAKDSIERGDYRKAIEHSLEARKLARELRDKADRVYSHLVNAAKRVAKLKKMGADVSEIGKILLEAKKAFEENRFEDAEKHSLKCIDEADKLESKAKVDYIKKEIDEMGKIMRELGLGNQFKKISKEFYTRYEDMKFDKLPDLGEKILETLRENVETILTDYIGKIETDLYDAKEKGYSIDINPEDLENAKDHFIKRNYLEALQILKKLENEIASIYEKNEKITELREQIKKTLDMASSLGVDVSKYREKINELSKMKNVEDAEREATRIIKEIETAIKKKVKALITKVEGNLDKLRRKGEDITAAESMLNRAKTALQEGKYGDAISLTIAAMGEIEKFEMQKNTAYGILKRMETKIKALRKILPPDIIKEYDEAKKLFLKGMYQRSIEISMQIGEKLSNIERMIEIIKERNAQVKEMVQKAHRLGMDVRPVLKLFNEAKEEFKKMNYEKSLHLVEQCYAEAKLLLKDAMNKYKAIYSKILTLIKRLDLEKEFEDELKEINTLFEKGDFETLKVKLSSLNKELEKKLEEITERMMAEFKEKKRMFKELKIDVGLDLEREEATLRELKAKDHIKFLEHMHFLNERFEKYMPYLIKTKIDRFKERLYKYEKHGVNIDEYQNRISEILSTMEEKDYREIFTMIDDVERNFERYLKEYIKTLIERVKKRVGDYSKEKAEEFASRMQKHMESGNYIDAIQVYEEANNFVAKYKLFAEEFGREVEELKDRLRFGLSLGLKLGPQISKLKEIEELTVKDTEEAKKQLKALSEEIESLINSLEPKLEISLEVGDKVDGKYAGRIRVKNAGTADAMNVKIKLTGSFTMDAPLEILKVEKNSEEVVDVLLVPGAGEKLNIEATFTRFDGKEYSVTQTLDVQAPKPEEERQERVEEKAKEPERVEEKPELEIKAPETKAPEQPAEEKPSKGYRIEKAKEKVKCSLCRGTILPAMKLDIVICENCGAVYHVPCAKRLGKCLKCGTKFDFE